MERAGRSRGRGLPLEPGNPSSTGLAEREIAIKGKATDSAHRVNGGTYLCPHRDVQTQEAVCIFYGSERDDGLLRSPL